MSEQVALATFLTDVADAIRQRKVQEYQDIIVSTHAQINSLLTNNTEIGSTEGSGLEEELGGFASGNETVVMIKVKDFGNNPSVLLFYKTSGSLALSDLIFATEYDSGLDATVLKVTNSTNVQINMDTYYLDSNNKWGTGSGTTVPLSSSQTYNTSRIKDGNPFVNTLYVPVADPIKALDFPTEILNLPEGGSILGESVLSSPFVLDSGESQRPGPYDQDGYNYDPSIITPSATNSVTKTLTKSLEKYSTMSIIWDMTGYTNPYGDISSKISISGNETYLYNDSTQGGGATISVNGDIITTIDVSAIGNVSTVTFTNYAYTRSSYRGFISDAITNIKGIYVK